MLKKTFISFCSALALSTAAFAQQKPAGALSAQQVMTALAGIRSDMTLALDENKRLTLRVEALEEELQKRDEQIRNLQTQCNTLDQQLQSMETRMNQRMSDAQKEIQKSLDADQKRRAEDFKNLAKDINKELQKGTPSSTPAKPVGPTIELKIESGDTLSSIAKIAGCTVKEIMAVNPKLKSADDLRVGQVILVPKK